MYICPYVSQFSVVVDVIAKSIHSDFAIFSLYACVCVCLHLAVPYLNKCLYVTALVMHGMCIFNTRFITSFRKYCYFLYKQIAEIQYFVKFIWFRNELTTSLVCSPDIPPLALYT